MVPKWSPIAPMRAKWPQNGPHRMPTSQNCPKHIKNHRKTIQKSSRNDVLGSKNRYKTAAAPEIDEERFRRRSPRPPFWPQVRFLSILGFRLGPKMGSGTRLGRFKFFINLHRISKTVPTGSREAPGRSQGTPRDLPGPQFLVDF